MLFHEFGTEAYRRPGLGRGIGKAMHDRAETETAGGAEIAYSGVAQPRVDAALDWAARLGFGTILVFPYFLFTGVLVKRIYAHTDQATAKFPQIAFRKAGCLGDHELVIDALLDRVVELESDPLGLARADDHRRVHPRSLN